MSPWFFRRLSATIAGVIPGLAPVRSLSMSSTGGERRASALTDFRYHTTTSPRASMNANRAPEVEPTAFHERDVYLPCPSSHHLSSQISTSIPLSSISAVSIGFRRQSTNLEKLEDLKDGEANLSMVDTLHTLSMGARTPRSKDVKVGGLTVDVGRGMGMDGGSGAESKRGSETNPVDDEYAVSSYTPLTRDEVIAPGRLALSA